MIEINKIYNENCLETVKRMPDNYLDCVITSPPYWQLRDYGYDGQWGLEPTYQQYLENLWSLMDAIYPKLKDGGTVWVNLGDTYNGTKLGNTSNKGFKENTVVDTFKKQKIEAIKDGKYKSKQQIIDIATELYKVRDIDFARWHS